MACAMRRWEWRPLGYFFSLFSFCGDVLVTRAFCSVEHVAGCPLNWNVVSYSAPTCSSFVWVYCIYLLSYLHLSISMSLVSLSPRFVCTWKALRETDPDRWLWMCGSFFSFPFLCVCVCYLLFRLTFLSVRRTSCFSLFSLSLSSIMYTSRAGKLFCNSRCRRRSSSSVGCPAGGALQSVERATERGAPAQVGGAETTSKQKKNIHLYFFLYVF